MGTLELTQDRELFYEIGCFIWYGARIPLKTRSFLIFITLLGVAWPTSQLSGQVTVSCDLQEDFIVLGCFGGLDCIPALTNPVIVKASEASYLLDSDLVLGVIKTALRGHTRIPFCGGMKLLMIL